MKKSLLVILSAVALVLTACIPSLNRYYTDRDLVFDARLLGTWQEVESGEEPEIWKFEKVEEGGKGYKLLLTSKGAKSGQFHAHLFKLKDELFLDLIPAEIELSEKQVDLVGASLFPGHLLVRVSKMESELKLSFFDFSWLEKYLKENPKALAHHVENERIVLTASTKDLQQFVMKHLNELFDKPGTLRRKADK